MLTLYRPCGVLKMWCPLLHPGGPRLIREWPLMHSLKYSVDAELMLIQHLQFPDKAHLQSLATASLISSRTMLYMVPPTLLGLVP